MRMCPPRFLSLFALAATLATGSSAATPPTAGTITSSPAFVEQEDPVIFVPGALAGSDPQIWTLLWALNNGDKDATVRLITKWDPAGEHDLALADPVTIAAGGTAYIYKHAFPDPSDAVQFLALSVPPGVVIRPMLHRTNAGDSAGALTLPVFTSLVPANTRSVAGSFRSSYAECVAGARRRLNITLLNAGDVSATFHVAVAIRTNGIKVGPPDDRETRTTSDYLVPPRTVRQINAVPYDVDAFCDGWQWGMAWVEIIADQPYLAYASTVRNDESGILPYEVFPALTGQ